MYKNKTLRGLAISAIVALGFSGLATAPASANYGLADKSFVSIAPSAGDEWAVFADGEFTVRATKAASLTVGTLKLLVEDTNRDLRATSSSTVNANASVAPSTYTGSSADGLTRASATNGTFVLAASASGAVTVDFPLDAAAAKTIFSSSFEVKVTAWNDANLDGLIQATEFASPTETIKFVDGDDLAMAVTLNRPVVGADSISAAVSFTPTLNHEQGASFEGNKSNLTADIVFTRGGFAATESSAASTWDAVGRTYTVYSKLFSLTNASNWDIPTSSNTILNGSTVSMAVAGTAVFTTANAHNVAVGDGMTFGYTTATIRATVSSIVSATSFRATVPATTATASAALATVSGYVSVYDLVTAGDYTVREYRGGVAGVVSELATLAVTSRNVSLDIVGSANVQPLTAELGDKTVFVRTGTTTVQITATAVNSLGTAVGAGRAVVVSNTNRSSDVRINGKTGSDTLLTDANGQVRVTVTSTAGASTAGVTLTFTPEGVAAAATAVTLDWNAASYGLVDLSVANDAFQTTRTIVAGGSYTMDLAVLDQWFVAPPAADTYRLVVTGAGAANGLVPVTAGKAQVTVADNGTATSYVTSIVLQRLGTNGLYAAVAGGTQNVTTNVRTGSVTLGADATSLFANATTVKLTSPVAAAALVEADLRVAAVAIPDYKGNNAVVTGKVRNASTGVNVPGATVTITGASSLLFNVDKVYKRGSITVVADSNGDFVVNVFSTTATAATGTVVTVASLGGSATRSVIFTGIGVGEGTKLEVTTPATVEPASTLQVKAKLTDTFSNAVEATAGRIKVSYTGPGIIFGALPTATDKDGELMFSALLGAADKGSITVVVSYDQNGDGDFVDAKDLNTTKVVTIAAAPAPVVVAPEVNAVIGSFNGRWAVRVENAKGAVVSVKVGNRWVKYTSLNDNYLFSRQSRVGATLPVAVYVNGTLENVATITIK